MKKVLVLLAAAAAVLAGPACAEDGSAGLTLGWESAYVFRGIQYADDIFVPQLEASYGDLYANIWAAVATRAEDDSEIDYTAGYGRGLGDTFSADAGLTYYTYPNGDGLLGGEDNTLEAYAGLLAEMPASPALYVAYDFQLENVSAELKASHEQPLMDQFALEASAAVGRVWIGLEDDYLDGPDGDGDAEDGGAAASAYWYGGVALDLRYDVADGLALRLGGRASVSSVPGLYNDEDYALWYGASLAYSYGS